MSFLDRAFGVALRFLILLLGWASSAAGARARVCSRAGAWGSEECTWVHARACACARAGAHACACACAGACAWAVAVPALNLSVLVPWLVPA